MKLFFIFHRNQLQETNLLLSRDKDGVSPILKAAELGNLGMVNMLITKVPQVVKTSDSVSGKKIGKIILNIFYLDW